jgi:hypothetical protein
MVIAAQAPGLEEALERAVKEGTPYVILDGKIVSSGRRGLHDRPRTAGIDNGLFSAVPGFGMNTRRAGSGRYRFSLSSPASSSSSRATPRSSTAARVTLSMPGAPSFRRTMTHARHRTSLRWTLSYSPWNLRPGSALAAR